MREGVQDDSGLSSWQDCVASTDTEKAEGREGLEGRSGVKFWVF